ncbi:carbon catabolite repressor protein 4 homolog 4-like [Gossypium raimondii]|uniref:carbon catabolite repressor protein 4 homolog 4-like n=1 Tax=Gossypium raimondii TaxID=29730 RepID=UPI00227A8ED9|nr:carbon catabolite repressor protein 4 homolog 4-like [Gossypium raimondii]
MEDLGYSSNMFREVDRSLMDVEYFIRKTELLLEETIEYNDLVPLDKQNAPLTDRWGWSKELESPEHRGDPNDPCGRLKRDCVGIMAAFKLKQPFHHAVAHLYWDPRLADVKLAQAEYLLARLAQFKTLVTDRFECTPSLILTGDFNSTPGQGFSVSYFCLMPVSILQLPELDSGALSNYSHPSDHLPIGAKFEITKDQMFILRNERKSVYQKN